MKIQTHMDMRFEQPVAGGSFVEGERLAPAKNGESSHVHINAVGIEFYASAPGRGENAAPIGVAAGKSGFH